MSDFAQAGSICTLQRLNEGHLARLEEELASLAVPRPITLVLPCHGGDLRSAALAHIIGELKPAAWLSEIIVSLNGLDDASLADARALFAPLPQRITLLWNDAPRLREPLAALLGCAPDTTPHGKGLNVWTAFGVASSELRSGIVATQDCDVSSFRRETLARLCYACAHPGLGFAFAKMYYSRVTDRLYGRVTRLFMAPLLHAVVRVTGHQPLLDFLLAFRYPLAGECAMEADLAGALPLEPGWGLEASLLCELFRRSEPHDICQVDGGPGYDHRHQPLTGRGLARMAGEIADALFAQLAAEGLTLDDGFREALTAAYRKESTFALRRSSALALMNGLSFDAAEEKEIIEAFAAQLNLAAPHSHLLPSWQLLFRTKLEDANAFLHLAQA